MEVFIAAKFLKELLCQEDQDNMEIERLAEILRSEQSSNSKMIDACKNVVFESAALFVQRVLRGHWGRRKYRTDAEKIWAEQSVKTSLVLQAAYRGMVGRREARAAALAEEKIIRNDASVSIQRIVRGKQSRRVIGSIRQEINQIDQIFFRSKGHSEAQLYQKRNHKIVHEEDEETSGSEDSDSDDASSFIVPEHPRTGSKLQNVPSYGAHIHETPKDYYYPACRRRSEEYKSGSSDDDPA